MSPAFSAPPAFTVIFDIDYCLIDTSRAIAEYAQWFAATYGVPVEAVKAADQLHDGQRHAFFADLKKRHRIKEPITKLYADYCRRVPRLTPVRPEVCRMVRDLSDAGCRLAVLSNGCPDVQRAKLRHGGLLRYFLPHRIVLSGEWGPRKPDRALFDVALDAAEVADASTAVMVGDSLGDDVAGGTAAGLRTIWVAHGRRLRDDDPQPDHVVQTVTDAGPLLLTAPDLLVPVPA